jgi:hypothetical protein
MALKRITFIISIIAFVYFAYLCLLYFTQTEMPETGVAIHEMVMFPLTILASIFLVISLISVIRERRLRSTNFYSLLLLICVVIIVVLMATNEMVLE